MGNGCHAVCSRDAGVSTNPIARAGLCIHVVGTVEVGDGDSLGRVGGWARCLLVADVRSLEKPRRQTGTFEGVGEVGSKRSNIRASMRCGVCARALVGSDDAE